MDTSSLSLRRSPSFFASDVWVSAVGIMSRVQLATTFVASFAAGRYLGNGCAWRYIEGTSMSPTLHPEEVVFAVSFDSRPVQWLLRRGIMTIEGRIVSAAVGDGSTYCKRVARPPTVEADGDTYVWLLGDNANASFDSRNAGAFPAGCLREAIIAVIWPPRQMRML
jgi:hypothetical protein